MATYRGYKIELCEEIGYFVDQHGVSLGYCDSLAEIQSAIDDEIAGPDDERAREALGLPPRHRDDTPSLPELPAA